MSEDINFTPWRIKFNIKSLAPCYPNAHNPIYYKILCSLVFVLSRYSSDSFIDSTPFTGIRLIAFWRTQYYPKRNWLLSRTIQPGNSRLFGKNLKIWMCFLAFLAHFLKWLTLLIMIFCGNYLLHIEIFLQSKIAVGWQKQHSSRGLECLIIVDCYQNIYNTPIFLKILPMLWHIHFISVLLFYPLKLRLNEKTLTDSPKLQQW